MHTIEFQQPGHLTWAGRVIGARFDPAVARTIALAKGRHLRAVTVFDRFSEGDCCMHIASDGSRSWLRRSFLLASFAFPFLQLRNRRVTGLVPARNVRAIAFDTALGFREEGRIRRGLPDDDLIVMGMLREECRFVSPDFVRRIREISSHG